MKHQCFAVKPDSRERRIEIFSKGPGAGTIGWVLEIRWASDKIIVDLFVYDDQGLEEFGIPKIVSVSIRKGVLALAGKSETGLVSTEGYLRLLLYCISSAQKLAMPPSLHETGTTTSSESSPAISGVLCRYLL
ncbi:hypothetical protein HYFRA_00010681 [Hymenoscyphus fraxineus]|uniref:Uncharacterized protein n=1 Tax=Hymenoscyphus fraxineus TaxID=746836 RepID=A0A9N9PKL3_9HELO|nr:hypothetical protein HYFRA_00010681 [Hymenoscyphus fraxineus]